MKKIIVGICIVFLVLFFFLRNFGIQIGNITIGRQVNHFVTQKSNVKESHFLRIIL